MGRPAAQHSDRLCVDRSLAWPDEKLSHLGPDPWNSLDLRIHTPWKKTAYGLGACSACVCTGSDSDWLGVLPLPFIEPTFLLAFAAGILLALPLGNWFQSKADVISNDKPIVKFFFQLVYDLGLVFLFLAAVASTVSAAFQPGIYGTF